MLEFWPTGKHKCLSAAGAPTGGIAGGKTVGEGTGGTDGPTPFLKGREMKAAPFSIALLATFAAMGGCHWGGKAAVSPAAADANNPLSVLPDMDKAHKNKVDFAWYVTAPILRSVDPAVKVFATKMEADHKRLRGRLDEWAKKNRVDLTYAYAPGIEGTALKSMEKMQGDLVQADDNTTFQRDYLILTWTDLDWQRNLAMATIAKTQDADLKAYLQDSLDTQTREQAECRALLAKYKWGP